MALPYAGSKRRFARYLLPFITKHLTPGAMYLEPFLGGGNMMESVEHPHRMGNDLCPYIIAYFKAVQAGWVPPVMVSSAQYDIIKSRVADGTSLDDALACYVGFGLSHGGRWWAGFARDTSPTALRRGNDQYRNELTRAGWRRSVDKMAGVTLSCGSYEGLEPPGRSVIYCDPPYTNAKGYGKAFDVIAFWAWARAQSDAGHIVYVSNYSAPDDFVPIWQYASSPNLSPHGSSKRLEQLFMYEPHCLHPAVASQGALF